MQRRGVPDVLPLGKGPCTSLNPLKRIDKGPWDVLFMFIFGEVIKGTSKAKCHLSL